MQFDADSPDYGKVAYYVTAGNKDAVFRLSSLEVISGIVNIVSTGRLDYDLGVRNFDLTIQACDSGARTTSSPYDPHCVDLHALINITDLNDNYPIFSEVIIPGDKVRVINDAFLYLIYLMEGYSLGRGRFFASRPPTSTPSLNAQLAFSLRNTSLFGLATMPSGVGVLSTVANGATAGEYVVDVIAADMGSPALEVSTQFLVSVLDFPVFGRPSYSFDVAESTPCRRQLCVRLCLNPRLCHGHVWLSALQDPVWQR